jgi:hypothetical protein
MKKTTLFILTVMLPLFIAAQTKLMTIEEATGMNRKLFPVSLSQLQWTKSPESFAWVARNSLVLGSVKTDTRDTVLRLDTLNNRLKAHHRLHHSRRFLFHFKGSRYQVRSFNPSGCHPELVRQEWRKCRFGADGMEGGLYQEQ